MEIGIYGLGRFGTLWASILSEHHRVKVYSRNPARPTPQGVQRVDEDQILSMPVLFLCIDISALADVCPRIGSKLQPGSLVLDTCSVKVHPARTMKEHFPETVKILATHPMFGPDSAKKGIIGQPIVLCPVRAEQALVESWHRLFSSLGLDVQVMSPKEHDREAAFTQGITHFVGRILADLGLRQSSIATLGYKMLLEIVQQTCNDSWQLFLDLQRYNPYTEEMRAALRNSTDKMLQKLNVSFLTTGQQDN